MKSAGIYEIALRTARPSDREKIITLINRVAGERRYLQTIHYTPTRAWEWLLRVGHDSRTGVWLCVLVYGKEIIGMGRIFPDKSHSQFCPAGNLGLVLAPEWRAKGLGTVLLTKLIDIAQELGYYYLRADILKINQRSLRLFQKFEFKCTDINEIFWPARQKWVDEMTVERSIKPEGPLQLKS